MHFVSLTQLVLLWMTSLVPAPSVPWGPSYVETATAIVTACEERPAFGSAERCAAVLTAIAYHESRFQPDAIGDGGQSRGVWQVSRAWGLAPAAPVLEHARLAAELVDRSEHICHDRPLDERLGWYAAGGRGCGRPTSSRLRMRLAGALLKP